MKNKTKQSLDKPNDAGLTGHLDGLGYETAPPYMCLLYASLLASTVFACIQNEYIAWH